MVQIDKSSSYYFEIFNMCHYFENILLCNIVTRPYICYTMLFVYLHADHHIAYYFDYTFIHTDHVYVAAGPNNLRTLSHTYHT